MPRLSKKNTNHGFHTRSAHVFSSDEEIFSCAVLHFAVWSRDRGRSPMIHLLSLIYTKNLAQFRVLLANPDKFPNVSLFFFLLHRQVFRHQFCTNISHVQISFSNLWAAFLFKTLSSSIILTLNRRSFELTSRTTLTFGSFVYEIGLPERGSPSTFSRTYLKGLCHLKTIVLDRVASP